MSRQTPNEYEQVRSFFHRVYKMGKSNWYFIHVNKKIIEKQIKRAKEQVLVLVYSFRTYHQKISERCRSTFTILSDRAAPFSWQRYQIECQEMKENCLLEYVEEVKGTYFFDVFKLLIS